MRIKTNYIFIFFIIFFYYCNKTNRNIEKDLKNNLLALKNKYAPDTRVALWNIQITDTKVLAEVGTKEAYSGLVNFFTEKYPNTKVEIKLLPEKNFEQLTHALVNNSVSNIRAESKHASELVNQIFLGSPVRIFKKENDWYLCQTPNQYIGWINEQDIVLKDQKKMREYQKAKKVIYNQQYGFSYQMPDENSQVISDLVLSNILEVTEEKGNFYKIKYPDGRVAYVKKEETINAKEWLNRVPKEKNLVATAKKFMGIPYLWGGFSPKAIDCSGFSSCIYLMNGIVLQRDASQQIRYGTKVSEVYDYKNLRPGDLLFFGRSEKEKSKITHVAIYIGNSEFIHASGRVKVNSMDKSRDNYIEEYPQRFAAAVRIIGNEKNPGIEKIKENKFYQTIF